MKQLMKIVGFLMISSPMAWAIPPETPPSVTELQNPVRDESPLQAPIDEEAEHKRFDMDLFLIPALEDQHTSVQWKASLYDGTALPEITGEDEITGFRIPATELKPSRYENNINYFDVMITGTKPGMAGNNWLGRWLDYDQNPIQFIQRYTLKEDTVSSRTRFLRLKGTPLTEEPELEYDRTTSQSPTISTQMRSYDQTESILKLRNPPVKPVQQSGGVDVPDGGGPKTARHEQTLEKIVGGVIVGAILYYGLVVTQPEAAAELMTKPQFLYQNEYSRNFYQ